MINWRQKSILETSNALYVQKSWIQMPNLTTIFQYEEHILATMYI